MNDDSESCVTEIMQKIVIFYNMHKYNETLFTFISSQWIYRKAIVKQKHQAGWGQKGIKKVVAYCKYKLQRINVSRFHVWKEQATWFNIFCSHTQEMFLGLFI